MKKKEILEIKKEEIRQIQEEIKTEKKVEKDLERKKADKKVSQKIFYTIRENPIVVFFDKFLSQKNHKLIVPIASFFDTIFMIIPIDVITMAYIIRHKKTKLFPFSAINSFFTTLGTFVVYLMGYFFSEQIIHFFETVSSFLRIGNLQNIDYSPLLQSISDHQLILTFIASATSTIPFAILAFFAGGLKFNIAYFLISIFFGRFIKFFFISYLTKYYGPAALKKVSRNLIPVILIIFSLIILRIFVF